MSEQEWDAFYRVGRKGDEFYVVDENGQMIADDPLTRVEIANVGRSDLISGYIKEQKGQTVLSKEAQRELSSSPSVNITFELR